MSEDWKPYYGEAKSGPLHMKYTAQTDGQFVPCQPPHDCKHTDEMREAFVIFWDALPELAKEKISRNDAEFGYQAATASAEAKYLPVIEKLEAKLKRLNAIIYEVKIFMHVSHTLEGFNDSKPKILEMVAFEESLDELQALAAPLLKGE